MRSSLFSRVRLSHCWASVQIKTDRHWIWTPENKTKKFQKDIVFPRQAKRVTASTFHSQPILCFQKNSDSPGRSGACAASCQGVAPLYTRCLCLSPQRVNTRAWRTTCFPCCNWFMKEACKIFARIKEKRNAYQKPKTKICYITTADTYELEP